MRCPKCQGRLVPFEEVVGTARLQVVSCQNCGDRHERDAPVVFCNETPAAPIGRPRVSLIGTHRKVAVCVECGTEKEIRGCGRCSTCYQRLRKARKAVLPVIPLEHGEESPPLAEEAKEQEIMATKKTTRPCAKCDRVMSIVSRGLCGKCHGAEKKAGTLDANYPAGVVRAPKRAAAMTSQPSLADTVESLTPAVSFAADLRNVLSDIESMLLAKNAAYGNSALVPVRVFSKADPVEQIRVRLDDKISRLMRGSEYANEDTEIDLLGYLVLLRLARRRLS